MKIEFYHKKGIFKNKRGRGQTLFEDIFSSLLNITWPQKDSIDEADNTRKVQYIRKGED